MFHIYQYSIYINIPILPRSKTSLNECPGYDTKQWLSSI